MGVPHDADPRFSPDGKRLAFRSDAELGVDNIWIMDWAGCLEMDIRNKMSENAELLQALLTQREEEDMLASGVKETSQRKRARLVREGRLNGRCFLFQGVLYSIISQQTKSTAHRVTNETFRFLSDPRFHPSEDKLVATKWYTSSRSLGAGEAWEYSIPKINETVKVGYGQRLIGRTLPVGWSSDQYGDQQIGPEQHIWHGEDSIIFSKNVVDDSYFTYSKGKSAFLLIILMLYQLETTVDVHKGIYAIFERNLTSGVEKTLVDAFPGGASRPELSRDGRTLAFVRRVRDKEFLVLKDLETGTLQYAWDGLTYDLTTISAPMGTYPSFAFTPSDDAVIIWAAGQIVRVPLKTNSRGERVRDGSPTPIPFVAKIEQRVADTLHQDAIDIVGQETKSTMRVHALQDLSADATGERVVFQAAGVTYVQKVTSKSHHAPHAEAVPILSKDSPYYSPSFVPNAEHLVVHARWSDVNFTTLELADLKENAAYELTGLSLGRYTSPTVCDCSGTKRTLAFVKTGGNYLTGDIVATAQPGLYVAQFELPTKLVHGQSLTLRDIRFVTAQVQGSDEEPLQLRFLDGGNSKLLVQTAREAYVLDLASPVANTKDTYITHELVQGHMSAQISVPPPVKKSKGFNARYTAFVDFYHIYVAPVTKDTKPVWSKPGNSTNGLARLSLDGGHDVTWSKNGKKVFWLLGMYPSSYTFTFILTVYLGPYLHSFEIDKLKKCHSALINDKITFGISCTKELLEYQEIIVEHSTDIARLKKDAAMLSEIADSGVLVITNATLLTMETNSPADLIKNGILFVRDGVIQAVLRQDHAVIPQGVKVINAMGGRAI
jgi:hypothetical protein